MPKRKYASRRPKFSRKRRRTTRSYKRRSRFTTVNRSLQPFAQRYIARLKYTDSFDIPNQLGVPSPYVFRLNSIFDPNFTGIGHQPMGHDTLQTMYNRYRVIRCKWAIQLQARDGGNYYLCAVPTNGTMTPTLPQWDNMVEMPRCKYVRQNSGSDPAILRGSIRLPQLVGRTTQQYMADDRFQAEFGSNPAEACDLNIMAFNSGNLTGQPNCLATIRLIYTVECFDSKVLPQS